MFQPALGPETTADDIFVSGGALQKVSTFYYLGSVISDDCTVNNDIATRLQKAHKSYSALQKRLWSQKDIKVKTKIKVYKTVILTTLLCGSQSWMLYRRNIKELEIFHLSSLCRILRIHWSGKVSNNEVLKRSGMTGIECMITKQQLQWVSHVTRMNDRRLLNQVFYGQLLNAERRTGSQKLTYKLRQAASSSAECGHQSGQLGVTGV